jgi:hypothetical protein
MKKLQTIAIALILLPFLFCSIAPAAQLKDIKELTVVVPEDSITKFIKPLLPYRIEIGENFSGSFWVKSIEKIRINGDGISFSAHISGKDIGYTAKIGKRTANFKVGDVNLRNHWTASLRFDKNKKKLYIKPHVEGPQDKKDFSQGDIILDTLFSALSDMEYPVDVNRIEPITAELYDTVLTIKMNISDIYAAGNKLFMEIIPTAQKKESETKQ